MLVQLFMLAVMIDRMPALRWALRLAVVTVMVVRVAGRSVVRWALLLLRRSPA